MKVSELADKTSATGIGEYKCEDKDVESVYISDMVSDIITCAKANCLLLTLQTHKSVIAAANLVDVTAIVFARGKKPPEDVIALAEKAGIRLFCTDLDTWSFAMKLVELGIK
ncbi:MAG TPA: DRTGG domain-containing protein [Acidobacteriota bacterium]|nr:DRTGG domain-containing protein [Acidobacteriota bacterium]